MRVSGGMLGTLGKRGFGCESKGKEKLWRGLERGCACVPSEM